MRPHARPLSLTPEIFPSFLSRLCFLAFLFISFNRLPLLAFGASARSPFFLIDSPHDSRILPISRGWAASIAFDFSPPPPSPKGEEVRFLASSASLFRRSKRRHLRPWFFFLRPVATVFSFSRRNGRSIGAPYSFFSLPCGTRLFAALSKPPFRPPPTTGNFIPGTRPVFPQSFFFIVPGLRALGIRVFSADSGFRLQDDKPVSSPDPSLSRPLRR